MLKILAFSSYFIFCLFLTGCTNEDSEAKKLGFADKNEMFDIQLKGYENKKKYEEMIKKDEMRAKPLSEVTKWL